MFFLLVLDLGLKKFLVSFRELTLRYHEDHLSAIGVPPQISKEAAFFRNQLNVFDI